MVYKLRRVLLLSSIVLFGTLLSACGKKGPLYMPDHKPMVPAATPTPLPTQPPAVAPP